MQVLEDLETAGFLRIEKAVVSLKCQRVTTASL
jgi:hypothetical protein